MRHRAIIHGDLRKYPCENCPKVRITPKTLLSPPNLLPIKAFPKLIVKPVSGLHGSVEPAAAHPHKPRGRAEPRLHRVRQDLRNQLGFEATHPHPQQREAVPVRSVLQSLHPVLKPVPTQADALDLPHAAELPPLRSVLQLRNISIQAQAVLRLYLSARNALKTIWHDAAALSDGFKPLFSLPASASLTARRPAVLPSQPDAAVPWTLPERSEFPQHPAAVPSEAASAPAAAAEPAPAPAVRSQERRRQTQRKPQKRKIHSSPDVSDASSQQGLPLHGRGSYLNF